MSNYASLISGTQTFHKALENNCSHDEFITLLNTQSHCIFEMDGDYNLPIHLAIELNRSFEEIELLAQACIPSLSIRSGLNFTPFEQVCLKSGMSLSMRIRLLMSFVALDNSYLSYEDVSGKNVLHRICDQITSVDDLECIKYLISVAPNLISMTDQQNRTPLMYALSRNCPGEYIYEIVQIFLSIHRDIAGMSATTQSQISVKSSRQSARWSFTSSIDSSDKSRKLASNEPATTIYPIHLAFSNNSLGFFKLKIMDTLLQSHIQAARCKTLDGKFLFVEAIEKNEFDIADLFLPFHASELYDLRLRGDVNVLYYSILNDAPPSFIAKITALTPTQFHAKMTSSTDNAVESLCLAIKKNMSHEIIKPLIDILSSQCGQKTHEGYLPLHIALLSTPSSEVLNAIIDAYPEAIQIKDIKKFYPIHLAVKNINSSNDDILKIASAYPDAICKPDGAGDLPMQSVISSLNRSTPSSNLVLDMMKLAPGCLKIRDRSKNLPVHVLLHSSSSGNTLIEALRPMLALHQEAIKQKDSEGDLPLHIAISKSIHITTQEITYLMESYTDAITAFNSKGQSAISLILSSNYSIHEQSQLLQLSIDLNPKTAVSICAEFGIFSGYYLLHLLSQNRAFDLENIVEYVIRVSKTSAEMKSKDGDLPIHVALTFNAPLALIKALVDAFPQGLRTKNREKILALHSAVRQENISDQIIIKLLEVHPEATYTYDNEKNYPLHLAICSCKSSSLINSFLDLSPGALKMLDTFKNYPLHCILEQSSSYPVDLILRIISQYPEAVKQTNMRGELPIHIAIYKYCDISIIHALANLYKQGIMQFDKNGLTCIALIISSLQYSTIQQCEIILDFVGRTSKAVTTSCADSGVFSGLCLAHAIAQNREYDAHNLMHGVIEIRKNSVEIKSKEGDLPIHTALLANAPDSLIALLIDTFPAALSCRDKAKNLPLHTAVRNQTSDLIIAKILQDYPDAASYLDFDGKYPFHYAILNNKSAFVIDSFLTFAPKSLKILDALKMYPLHCILALGGGASTNIPTTIIIQMISQFPDATKQYNSKGDLPLHISIVTGKDIEILQNLGNAHKDGITQYDISGESPISLVLTSNIYVIAQKCQIILEFVKISPKSVAFPCAESGIFMRSRLLHAVLQNREFDKHELFFKIVEIRKNSVDVKSNDGDLPIHLALRSCVPEKFIFFLAQNFPQCLSIKDRNNNLPLHIAIKQQPQFSDELIIELLKMCPEACVTPDSEIEYPLHYALKNSKSTRIISSFIEYAPVSIFKISDKSKNLPLHILLETGFTFHPIEIILRFISAFPDSAKQKFGQTADLPIHMALSHSLDFSIIKSLAEANSNGILQANHSEDNCINMICNSSTSFYSIPQKVDIILQLITTNPKLLNLQDKNGLCLLHIILQLREFDSSHLIQRIIETNKIALESKSSTDELPIHTAFTCANHSPVPDDTIHYLIDTFPEGLKYKTKDTKSLPLHLSITHNINESIIFKLLTLYPDGVNAKDQYLNTPLHLSLKQGGYMNNISNKITELSPKLSKIQNKYGFYPLHNAILTQGSIIDPLLMLLLSRLHLPALLTKSDTLQKSPYMHLLVQNPAYIDICIELIQQNPSTVCQCTDMEQKNLLHILIEKSMISPHYSSLIMKVMDVCPATVLAVDVTGYPPVAYWITHISNTGTVTNTPNLRMDILQTFISKYPQLLKISMKCTSITSTQDSTSAQKSTTSKYSMLALACAHDNIQIVCILLSNCSSADLTDVMTVSPYHMSTRNLRTLEFVYAFAMTCTSFQQISSVVKHRGNVCKRSRYFMSWKPRHLVLLALTPCLLYYPYPSTSNSCLQEHTQVLQGAIGLKDCLVQLCPVDNNGTSSMSSRKNSFAFQITDRKTAKVAVFSCESMEQAQQWITVINTAIESSERLDYVI